MKVEFNIPAPNTRGHDVYDVHLTLPSDSQAVF